MSSELETRLAALESDFRIEKTRIHTGYGVAVVILGAVITFFQFVSLPGIEKNTLKSVEEKVENFLRTEAPLMVGWSVASRDVHYLLQDYSYHFGQKNSVPNRLIVLNRINENVDGDKVSADEISEVIRSNQASFLGVIPIVINDTRVHKEFSSQGHVTFWLLLQMLTHASGESKHLFVDYLTEKTEDANGKTTTIFGELHRVSCAAVGTTEDREQINQAMELISGISGIERDVLKFARKLKCNGVRFRHRYANNMGRSWPS